MDVLREQDTISEGLSQQFVLGGAGAVYTYSLSHCRVHSNCAHAMHCVHEMKFKQQKHCNVC